MLKYREGDDEDGEEELANNKIVNFCKSLFTFTDTYDGDNFFVVKDGVRLATPLLLVLLVIELSDVVFAVDSIPAVSTYNMYFLESRFVVHL